MQKSLTNYAFIDTQNLYMASREAGWKVNWERFFIYLREKFKVKRAYIFVGYLPQNVDWYEALREIGYSLVFKEVVYQGRVVKGNVDVELAVKTMIDLEFFDKAVLVSNDGDFAYLVKYLNRQNKLETVLSTSHKKSSYLLRKAAQGRIWYLNEVKDRIKNRSRTARDGTLCHTTSWMIRRHCIISSPQRQAAGKLSHSRFQMESCIW